MFAYSRCGNSDDLYQGSPPFAHSAGPLGPAALPSASTNTVSAIRGRWRCAPTGSTRRHGFRRCGSRNRDGPRPGAAPRRRVKRGLASRSGRAAGRQTGRCCRDRRAGGRRGSGCRPNCDAASGRRSPSGRPAGAFRCVGGGCRRRRPAVAHLRHSLPSRPGSPGPRGRADPGVPRATGAAARSPRRSGRGSPRTMAATISLSAVPLANE